MCSRHGLAGASQIKQRRLLPVEPIARLLVPQGPCRKTVDYNDFELVAFWVLSSTQAFS